MVERINLFLEMAGCRFKFVRFDLRILGDPPGDVFAQIAQARRDGLVIAVQVGIDVELSLVVELQRGLRRLGCERRRDHPAQLDCQARVIGLGVLSRLQGRGSQARFGADRQPE